MRVGGLAAPYTVAIFYDQLSIWLFIVGRVSSVHAGGRTVIAPTGEWIFRLFALTKCAW